MNFDIIPRTSLNNGVLSNILMGEERFESHRKSMLKGIYPEIHGIFLHMGFLVGAITNILCK